MLELGPQEIVVNVQGDEPMLQPALIRRMAEVLAAHPDASIATAAHPIESAAEAFNPNIVKVVCDAHGYALYFSRATIPWARDAFAAGTPTDALPAGLPLVSPLRPIRLPRRLPDAVSCASARADRAVRSPGTAARAVARLPDRRRYHRGRSGTGRGHRGRPGPGACTVASHGLTEHVTQRTAAAWRSDETP